MVLTGMLANMQSPGHTFCFTSRQAPSTTTLPTRCSVNAAVNSCVHDHSQSYKGDTKYGTEDIVLAAVQADAFEPEQWREQLQGAVGVVSCLGGFGSNEFMLKV